MDLEEAKKMVNESRDSTEFFDVFRRLASEIDLDLAVYCDKLSKRFEQKKTLSDKQIICNKIIHYQQGDIKEALKEYIDSFTRLVVGDLHKEIMLAKAIEIYGKEIVS